MMHFLFVFRENETLKMAVVKLLLEITDLAVEVNGKRFQAT